MNVYPKNSFDRFGDDMTELILSYLTFEDKIRLECVSKQWQRCVFQKQFVIEVIGPKKSQQTRDSLGRLIRRKNKALNRIALESVLKKCQNITNIHINTTVDSEVLSWIVQNCHYVKSLMIRDVTHEGLEFLRDNRHKLEELHLHRLFNLMVTCRFCPNLKSICFRSLDLFENFNHDKEFLSKLERIELGYLYTPKNYNCIERLSDDYSQTIKTLNVDLDLNYMTDDVLKICFDCICQFENLRQVKLIRANDVKDESLSMIGQKCTKLLKLDLDFDDSSPKNIEFFVSFSEFKAIKKLKIRLYNNIKVKASVECCIQTLQTTQ